MTATRYRIVHHPEPPNCAHYRVQYNRGWRTLWCWWTFEDYSYDAVWPTEYKTEAEAHAAIAEHSRPKAAPSVVYSTL